MQAAPNLPYQAYRNQTQSSNTPTPTQSRASAGYTNGNTNGSNNGNGLSEPVVPQQRHFRPKLSGGSQHELGIPTTNGVANGMNNSVVGYVSDQERRTVSMTDVIPHHETKRTAPPLIVSPVQSIEYKATIKSISPAPHSPHSEGHTSGSSTTLSSPAPSSPALPALPISPTVTVNSPSPIEQPLPLPASTSKHIDVPGTSSQPVPRPVRKSSTFRHIPLRTTSTRAPHPSSPLRLPSTLAHTRTASGLSVISRRLDAPSTPRTEARGLKTPEVHAVNLSDPPSRVSSLMSTPLVGPAALNPADRDLPAIPALELTEMGELVQPRPTSTYIPSQSNRPASEPHYEPRAAPSRSTSLSAGPSSSTSPQPQRASTTPTTPAIPSPVVSPSPSSSANRTATRTSAPYRPGFQPRGVYRPRTDEFTEARRAKRDNGRVEQTRLERRMEKLINLHFPHPDSQSKETGYDGAPNGRPSAQNRRASSFFDLESIRGKSASDLWKGVVQGQASSKNDIRCKLVFDSFVREVTNDVPVAAEQTITPWEDDASVSQCPLCSLYEAFVCLEKEIEDALPQFQELMLSLSHEERPSPEASGARKRLLEAFAQYDALAKRIRKLPCPGGPGSSQDRVQQAITTRANIFLQKNMFPLQALPKPSRKPSSGKATPSDEPEPHGEIIDPDSELARVLQPLLEQEALLESFVEEAKTHRKFEDAQTLKANLKEIRTEINRVMANGNVRLNEPEPSGRKGKRP
ncbi:hypothetical protein PHLCEN_2v4479 [Hermanssonia centrifuga]|uniref:Rabenosyn Rab binding domain-containing protein n=1 Tax=Hermanssonia centrifuga TaxID=98765 RepID=A0A2R6PNZ7_9APHY|nr:hypothetical protein PHLCEN_2v4479 [Hermanssonia centrifuga]